MTRLPALTLMGLLAFATGAGVMAAMLRVRDRLPLTPRAARQRHLRDLSRVYLDRPFGIAEAV